MRDDLIATRAKRRDQFRAMVVTGRVQQNRERQFVFFKQVKHTPAADPVAIFAPAPVIGIGMIEARRVRQAEARSIREMFDTKRDIDRELLVARPGEGRSPADALISETWVLFANHFISPCRAHNSAQVTFRKSDATNEKRS